MANLTSSIQTTSKNSEHITNSSPSILQMTDNGSRLMIESARQMQKVDLIVNDSVRKMLQLDNQSQEISKLIAGSSDELAE